METYDHHAIEKKWQAEWKKNGLYHTPTEAAGKENYYFLVEFPYPSGNLHIGHWYAFAVPDIFARYQRMRGLNVLYPIGFDAFGLPAENAAIKRGIDPRAWTEENIAYMRTQLESMGNSFDWSREVSTARPEFYRWTQWLFLQFYKNGLVERKKARVNWCPNCKTVLANEQVVGGACERCGATVEQRELEQWFMKITKYADRLLDDLEALDWPEEIKAAQRNWIGRSEGAVITFQIADFRLQNGEAIEVFTTRPDTLFGVTYMVLAPEHKLIDTLRPHIENWDEVEAYRKQAAGKTELERQTDQKEKTGVELKGIKAINPANNEEIPVWVADYVLAHYGTGAIMAVPAHDRRDFEFAKKYGLSWKQVISGPAIFSDTPELPSGAYFYAEEGILINSGVFTTLPIDEAKHKITEHVGGKMTTTYRLRDWLISRQRYWGTPIPIVYDPEGNPHAVPEEHLPWLLPDDVTDFTPQGTSPLGTSKELVERTERIFGKGWRPEVDTIDVFVDSSWYFLRYLDPKNQKTFASQAIQRAWMPVDRYSGGAEHTTVHLLYSRFWYKAMADMGLTARRDVGDHPKGEPYLRRMNRGLILGPDGRKMSKSKGNVIDPDEVVTRVGADAVKMYLAFIGPYNEPGQYPWDMGGIAGMRRFLERVWRMRAKAQEGVSVSTETESLLKRTTTKVGDDIAQFKFNTALSALMILTNRLEKEAAVSRDEYARLLVLLAPFAPHLTEEVWHELAFEGSVHTQNWPIDTKGGPESKVIVVQVNGRVRGQFVAESALAEDEALKRAKALVGVAERLEDRPIRRTVYVPDRLINFVVDE
jgi:leucyl-tRNA synthetase